MAEVSASDIEAYVASAINQDASTVAEVAPVAAQAAIELSGVTVLQAMDSETFVRGLSAVRREATNGAVVRVLRRFQEQYVDSTSTPAEVLQEIIDQIGG